ncbi:MAG: Archaetidylserine synthase [Candidatus Heimdallarchaeota archaeon LC_2]|nr:MAG: Archaetidylserine synthase [Candidatus Heimdallarchaeota archaeon LC_2]
MNEENIILRTGHKKLHLMGFEADFFALLANFSTLMNFSLGIIVTVAIVIGSPLDKILAMRFIMLGASFDAIDGRLARKSNTKPRLGAEFDTLADQATFGLAPSMLILDRFYDLNPSFAFLLAGLYLFAAWFRLSRFMLTPTYGFFNGMPSPVAATYVAAWYVLPDVDLVLFATNMALISAVMVVNLPYTAMKTVTTLFQKANFVFTITMMVLLTYSPNSWMKTLSIIWISNIFYFTIFGPYHARLAFKDALTTDN